MRSALCSSSATSSSRRSPTSAPRWRLPRRPGTRVETGSPACACGENWQTGPAMSRGPSRSPPCRTLASVPRPRAGKMRRRRGHAPSRTSSGLYWTSYRGRGRSCETSSTRYEGSWTHQWRLTSRSPLPSLPTVYTASARTLVNCDASGTNCLSTRPGWRRRSRPSARPLPPPRLRRVRPFLAPRLAGWTACCPPRAGRPRSRRRTPGSSRRFSSRAIPSSCSDICSPPPCTLR